MTFESIIDGKSLLLTNDGLVTCAFAGSRVSCAGIDRHGQIKNAEVSITFRKTRAKSFFVGTTKTCGFFAPTSVLMDVSGHLWNVQDLILHENLSDLRFETAVEWRDLSNSCAVFNSLWTEMVAESAVAAKDFSVIRCRRDTGGRSLNNLVGESLERGGRTYVRFVHRHILDCLGRGGSDELVEALSSLFENDENKCELSRSSAYVSMLIAARKSGGDYSWEFQYDSIQHTAVILLARVKNNDTTLGKGRCGCIISEEGVDFELKWSTGSWNPICNGAVLVGARD